MANENKKRKWRENPESWLFRNIKHWHNWYANLWLGIYHLSDWNKKLERCVFLFSFCTELYGWHEWFSAVSGAWGMQLFFHKERVKILMLGQGFNWKPPSGIVCVGISLPVCTRGVSLSLCLHSVMSCQNWFFLFLTIKLMYIIQTFPLSHDFPGRLAYSFSSFGNESPEDVCVWLHEHMYAYIRNIGWLKPCFVAWLVVARILIIEPLFKLLLCFLLSIPLGFPNLLSISPCAFPCVSALPSL